MISTRQVNLMFFLGYMNARLHTRLDCEENIMGPFVFGLGERSILEKCKR